MLASTVCLATPIRDARRAPNSLVTRVSSAAGGVASPEGSDKAPISPVANGMTPKTQRTHPFFMTEDGRIDPRFLRPFSPAILKRTLTKNQQRRLATLNRRPGCRQRPPPADALRFPTQTWERKKFMTTRFVDGRYVSFLFFGALKFARHRDVCNQ